MAKKRDTKSILIIEDEAEVQNLLARVLELEGYSVLQAGDGERGIALAKGGGVALVLLDLRLPGRDGWTILAEMKSKPALSAIPVVVLTASAAMPQRERALSMGAADYLVKPLSAASLREAVARILAEKNATEINI